MNYELIKQLQSQHFDIREYLLKNFISSDFSINYQKISQTLPQILQIQHQTCEDIADSVDSNFEDYVHVSAQLSGLTGQLETLTNQFQSIESNIEITTQNLQFTLDQINVIVSNLEVIQTLKKQQRLFIKLIKYMKNSDKSIDNFSLIDNSERIIKIRQIYERLDKSPHYSQLCEKYELAGEINHQYSQFRSTLESEFVICLQEQDIDMNRFQILLRCFNILGLVKTPEKLLIQLLLKPKLDLLFEELIKSNELIDQEKSKLDNFITQVQSIYQNFKIIDESQIESFSFKQILMELVYMYLSQKDCSSIYSLGVLDIFQQNFLKIQKLKSYLQVSLRGQIIEKRFFEKWNLNTYFSLRQTEIIKNFEQQLQVSQQDQIHQILEQSMKQCFNDKILIKQLLNKFVILSIYLINRFIEFIESKNNNNNDIDNCQLINNLSNIEFPQILSQELIEIQKQKILKLITELGYSSTLQITKQCVKNLEPFSGIPAKYRMTNREMPTQPSNFCSNVFTPLSIFIQKIEQEQVKQHMSIEVCKETWKQFLQIQQQALETCDKNEELLQKMGVKKKDSQDNNKIRYQFELDKKEMNEIIQQKFHVDLN